MILHIIGMIGVDGALYKSMEFMGEGIKSLSPWTTVFAYANMAIEAGAKNGIFTVDEITEEYMKGRVTGRMESLIRPDEDAEYVADVMTSICPQLQPTVSFPHLPENTKTIDEVGDVPIEQVVIGSCTNGRLEDMALAAEILKGQKGSMMVYAAIIIPATQQIYLQRLYQGRLHGYLHRCRMPLFQHTDLRAMPGRPYGHPCRGRTLRGHYQPELRRPYGSREIGSISGQPGSRCSICRHRQNQRDPDEHSCERREQDESTRKST